MVRTPETTIKVSQTAPAWRSRARCAAALSDRAAADAGAAAKTPHSRFDERGLESLAKQDYA
jgi:hypothetical protein